MGVASVTPFLHIIHNKIVKYNWQGGAMNEKMKQARLEKNLSQTELAKIIGVSRQGRRAKNFACIYCIDCLCHLF